MTPRQKTIEEARIWLSWKCPASPPEEIHAAAVRIANIVLKLHVDSDLAALAKERSAL